VIVIVIVIEPVIVAVHVNRNDTVIVIQPVDDRCTDALLRPSGLSPQPARQWGTITSTVSFPFSFTSRITGAITITPTILATTCDES
jgi:hypothetical protein